MKIAGTACLLLLAFSLPLSSHAQSLGNVAKKERERRDKNKEAGVTARVFSEEEIFGEKEVEQPSENEPSEANKEGESIEETSPSAAIPVEDGLKIEEVSEKLDRESRERRRGEVEWRSRASTARARVAVARERVRFLEQLYLGPFEHYVDENGKTVFRSAEHLMQVTQQARDELAAAEKDWKQMQEEARHAGIPPGWLR